MSRHSNGRFVLTGLLKFHEPFLIGGVDTDAGVDVSPMFNGAGDVLVPGTSLAGVLRSWITANCADISPLDIENIFGGIGDYSGASRIRIDDVALRSASPGGILLSNIDGVGIDRYTGAAAHGVKFDQTVVAGEPIGCLRIVCEVSELEDPLSSTAHKIMQSIASVLSHKVLRLGRGTTKGFGLFSVQNVSIQLQRATQAGLFQRLAGTGEVITLDPRDVQKSSKITSITIKFDSVGGVFTKASTAGTIVDVIPRVEPRGGSAELILPATSIRGVLRSEAERIVRTLLSTEMSPVASHIDQVRVPLVDAMYGASPTTNDGTDQSAVSTEETMIGKACVNISAAFAPICDCDQWKNVLEIATRKKSNTENDRANAEQELVKATAGLPLEFTHHVALDRWTGAAADKMLYTVLEPTSGQWSGLKLELDEKRLGERYLPALALLLHTLQSLHSGDIGLGWGTYRGHGTIQITSISIKGSAVNCEISQPGEWLWSDLEANDSHAASEIKKAWKTWLQTARGGAQ